jgi:hypothetical protein
VRIQRAYRRRRRDAEEIAQGKPAGQTTSLILKDLTRQLAQLDGQSKADVHDTVRAHGRSGHGRVVQALWAQGLVMVMNSACAR